MKSYSSLLISFKISVITLIFATSVSNAQERLLTLKVDTNDTYILTQLAELRHELAKNNISTNDVKFNRAKMIALRELSRLRRIYNNDAISGIHHYFTFEHGQYYLGQSPDSLINYHIQKAEELEKYIELLVEHQLKEMRLKIKMPITVHFRVLGFASQIGSMDFNYILAEKRAEYITNLLNRRHLNTNANIKFIYCPYSRGEKVLHEMKKLEDKYKRSAVIVLDCINVLENTESCSSCGDQTRYSFSLTNVKNF